MEANYSPNGKHQPNHQPKAAVNEKPVYQLTRDPIFYVMVGFFALLTTALPGLMGQPNFMPITQALGLTIFAAIPLRRSELRSALGVLLLWLGLQVLIMILMAWLLPVQITRAIPDGFTYRINLITWAYTGDTLPQSLLMAPLARFGEIAGVLLGSLLTGGLIGSWFLVRAVDLFGYGMGTFLREVPGILGLLIGLAPWRLLTLAGYAGFFLLLAQPILTNRWHLRHYLKDQRHLLLWSAGLLIAGIILEAFLPGVWQRMLNPG